MRVWIARSLLLLAVTKSGQIMNHGHNAVADDEDIFIGPYILDLCDIYYTKSSILADPSTSDIHLPNMEF